MSLSNKDYRVFVIGLDGATLDLMLPWIDQGLLPNLGRLLHGGVYGRLQSTTPPITPCAWSSFMTGKNPGKHGLFDFVEPGEGEDDFRFTNASSRNSETLWGLLSRHGRRVGAVNVPMTYPPEKVNGYMISGLDTPHEGSRYTFPEELKKELNDAEIPYRVDLRHLGDMRTDRLRECRLSDLKEMESIRTDAMLHLRRHHPVDCNMVVYIATDQVQHHFWHYMDPEHDKHDPRGAERFGNAIRDVYVHLDGHIGRLLDDLDENTVVAVMSDHGFGPTSSARLRLNRLLADHGLLKFSDEGAVAGGSRALMGGLERLLRSTLTPGLKARLAAMFPRLRSWVESAGLTSIDWSETVAYANESYMANPAVWLNRKGKLAGANEEEIDDALGRVEDAIRSAKDPKTGRPLVREIVRTREIYTGEELDKAPDLLLSWWEDGFLQERSGPAGEEAVVRSTEPVVGGVEFAGGHKLDGVFMLHGEPIRRGLELEGAEIIDIAPTLLYLMGLPIPEDMDGRVLMDAIDPEFAEGNPLRYESSDKSEERFDAPDDDYPGGASEEDAELVRNRLRALGYID